MTSPKKDTVKIISSLLVEALSDIWGLYLNRLKTAKQFIYSNGPDYINS